MARRPKGSSAETTEVGSEKVDIGELLRARMSSLPPSEKSVAAYMLDNVEMVPFETGASIAQATGVSVMTVSRFINALGFQNLRDLKDKLRKSVADKESDVEDYMARFKMRDRRHQSLQESLRLELDAIVKAYGLATTELWDEAIAVLAKARTVYVVGFQAIKGLAMDFSSRLLLVRPNVIFVESASSTYGEILAAEPRQSVVVMVDAADYAARAMKLAEKVNELRMPLIIVTDKFSHWALDYTRFSFEAHSQVKTYWDSSVAICAVLNLMTDAVATKLGPKAKAHTLRLHELSSTWNEFVRGPYKRGID